MTGIYDKKAERLIKDLVRLKFEHDEVRVADKVGGISFSVVSGKTGTYVMFLDCGKPRIEIQPTEVRVDGAMLPDNAARLPDNAWRFDRLDKLVFKWDGEESVVDWLSGLIELVVGTYQTMRKVVIEARSRCTTIAATAGSLALSTGSTPFNIIEFNTMYGRAYLSDVNRKQG